MQADETWPVERPSAPCGPSGRVDVLRLIPLLGASLSAALIMAASLLWAEGSVFIVMATSIFCGLLAVIAWLTVVYARCRDERVALLLGALLGLSFNAAYWELSYRTNVAARGPAVAAAVEEVGGLPGLLGYFQFCCKTDWPEEHPMLPARRKLGTADVTTKVGMYALQAIMACLLPMIIGRSAASRAYSDRLQSWASSIEIRLPTSATYDALDAVDRGDWALLAALPRMVCKDFTPTTLVRIEYYPDDPSGPIHLTVRPASATKGWYPIRRREVPRDQIADLRRAFPALRVGPTNSNLADSWSDTPDGSKPRDFRDEAVVASRLLVEERLSPDLFSASTSLCIPASAAPLDDMRRVGRRIQNVHRILLAVLGLFLGLFAIGLMIRDRHPSGLILAGSGAMGVFGVGPPMAIFWARGPRSWRRSLTRRFRHRGTWPNGRRRRLPSEVLVLQDGEAERALGTVRDDLGVAFFDREGRRIVFEGVSHRYVIRGEDVVGFHLLCVGHWTSLRLDVRIGRVVLPMTFGTTNPYSHIPAIGEILTLWFIKRIDRRFQNALALDLASNARSANPRATG